MQLKISHNTAEIQLAMMSQPARAQRALAAALNKTAAKANTATSREIRKDYNVKAQDISRAVKITSASRHRLEATISVRGKPIGILKFGASPKEPMYPPPKRGVTYRIEKSTGRSRLPHAFVAVMKSGHLGVFQRKGSTRLPIYERVGPSMPQLFKFRRAWAALEETVRREMPIEWNRAWTFFGGKL